MLAILSVVAALFSGQMLAQNITSSLPAVNKAVTAGPGFNDTMPCNPYASSGPDNTTGGFAINPVVMAGPSGKSSYTTGLASYGTGTSSQPLYIKYFGSKGQTDNGVVFTGPVTVYAIYYGGGEATDKALSVMEDFITWFGTSQYWKTITQNFYQINWDGSKSYPGTLTKAAFNSHLNVAGKYLNNMGRGNSNVTYNMLQDEFAGWITNGSVTTNNGIYSYFLDSNVMISDNQGNAILNSGSNTLAMYCGIHNFFSIGGKAYFYTIAPKFTDTLYGSQFTCMRRASAVVGIPNATSIPKVGIWFEYYNTWVHELVEVITDPSLGTAWYSAVDSKSGEVSELMDICENNFHGKLGFNKINYNVDVTVNGNSYNWLLQSLYNPTTGLCEWPCTNNACV